MAAPEMPDPFAPPPELPADEGKKPARPGSTPAWMTEGGKAKQKAGRGAAVTVGLFLTVAVVGALVAVLLLLEGVKDPYLIAIPVFGYDDAALPPAAWVEKDAELLTGTLPKEAFEFAKSAQGADKFREKLRAIKAGQVRVENGKPVTDQDRPFALYVAGLGATDGTSVFVLSADTRAEAKAKWVKVEEILDAMEGWPSEKKLLILDLSRPTAGPFAGPFADDVTTKLHEFLEKTPLPCPVLTACGPGETGHMIPGERCSAFAFYLAEGMKGYADGYNADKSHDQTVKVRELAEFVAARVSRWAEQNTPRKQEPRLYDNGRKDVDFKLVLKFVPPPPKPKDDAGVEQPYPPTSSPLPYPAELLAVWKERDAALPAVALAGGDFTRYEAKLTRVERIVSQNGEPPGKYLKEAEAYRDRVLVAKAEAARPGLKYRTLLAVPTPPPAAGPAGTADPVKDVRTAAANYFLAAAPPSGGRVDDKVIEAALKDFKKGVMSAPADVAAKEIWLEFQRSHARPDRNAFTAANTMLRECLKDSTELYVEAAALARVAETNVTNPRRGEEGRDGHGALFAAETAMADAARAGSEGFPWVADRFTAADAAKRSGEAELFAARDGGEVAAATVKLKQARAQFDDVKKRQKAVVDARAALADASRVCAGSALSAADFDRPAADAAWKDLAEKVAKLEGLVSRPPPPDWSPDELQGAANNAAEAAAAVKTLFAAAAVKAAIDRPIDVATKQNLAEYRSLLASPLVAADDRKLLWDKFQTAAKAFHDKTRKESDGPDNDAKKPTEKSRFNGTVDAAAPGRRARVAVQLLAVIGVPSAAELNAKLGGGPGAVLPGVRAAWGQEVPKMLKAHADAGDWLGFDRHARAFPAGAWPDEPVGKGVPPAGVLLRRQEEDAYRLWVAGHYRVYGTLRKDVPTYAGRYENEAANAARRAAE